MSTPQVRVGVAVFILSPSTSAQNQRKVLLGLRLNSHGSNTWALPGGHLEFGESFEDCARREVKEETDLDLRPGVEGVRFVTATDDFMPVHLESTVQGAKEKHYVTIFMAGELDSPSFGESNGIGSGEEGKEMPVVKLMEPDKCAGWEWVDWTDFLAWAHHGIQSHHDEGAADQGDPTAAAANANPNRKLFLPLLNLLRQRPDVVADLGRLVGTST